MRAIARRHAYVLVRSPHRLFDVTLWPLVDVVLFGSLAAFVGTSSASGTAKASGYLLAGIVLWHVIYQSQIAMSTGFLEETWTRNLLNMMVTPVREVEYVAGVALFGMIKLVMGVGVMVIGALAFFSFHAWSLGFGLIPIAVTLLIVGWAISLFVIGLVLRFGTGAEALGVGRDVRAAAALGRLLPDRRAAHRDAADRAGAADHARVRARCAASSTARGLNWTQVDDRRGRLGRDAAARGLVPRADAHDVPQARLHHALHLISARKKAPASAPGPSRVLRSRVRR